jgi:hypothetical protein
LSNEVEIGRPLNNLINRMPEFEHFTAVGSKRWTLPMAAAWFIWRDLAAVDDQWKIVTGRWAPAFDPPVFILSHLRRQPGTLACVFQQAGFARGERPYVRLQDIRDPPSRETADPYERLRLALQSGRMRATIVQESTDEGDDWGMDDWLDFDSLADPANDAPYHFLSDPALYAVLVSREEALRAEAELSAAEAERLVWKLEQALGWIAYRTDQGFRSLGRIDLQSPTCFGRSYKRDFVEPPPLATLTAALLSDQLHAYVRGVALTREECISLLSENDGLWSKEGLVFLPDEIRAIWKRKAESGPRSTIAAEKQALADLKAHLKEKREIRETKMDTRVWLKTLHPNIGTKAFERIWEQARADPDFGRATVGRPPGAPRIEATPQSKS